MISGFMSSEKPQPQSAKGAHREADFYDLLAWIEVNRQKVIAGALALVVVGFIIATVRYTREQKEIKASSQLLAMKVTLNLPTNAVPPAPSEFLGIAENFSGTSAAERARILAGTGFFTRGKYSEAETEFSRFINDFPESPWVANAALGVAAAQEAQNEQDALASYQNVTTAYSNSAVADDARLAMARIYEMREQPDQALRIYNELLVPRPGAQPGEPGHPEALARKEALLRANPELNTNNAAAAAPAMPFPVTSPQTGEATLELPTAPVTNSAAPGDGATETKTPQNN